MSEVMKSDWLPMPRYKLRKFLVRKILESEIAADKSCIELGYGAGDMLLLFAELGFRVYGYDFSEMAYDNALERISEYPVLKKRIALLKNEQDIVGRKYDYVMAFEVLEHIRGDEEALKAWYDLLNDSGKLLLSVPAHMDKWGRNDFESGHFRRYEKPHLIDSLEKCGFRIISFSNYGYPLSIMLDPFLHRASNCNSNYADVPSKEMRSKLSGVNRRNNFFNRLISSDVFLLPFCILQAFFLKYDLGSSYLISAQKPSK